MLRDVLFEEVTTGNERIKMSYKRKCVAQHFTVQRQRESYGYRVGEVAERLPRGWL